MPTWLHGKFDANIGVTNNNSLLPLRDSTRLLACHAVQRPLADGNFSVKDGWMP